MYNQVSLTIHLGCPILKWFFTPHHTTPHHMHARTHTHARFILIRCKPIKRHMFWWRVITLSFFNEIKYKQVIFWVNILYVFIRQKETHKFLDKMFHLHSEHLFKGRSHTLQCYCPLGWLSESRVHDRCSISLTPKTQRCSCSQSRRTRRAPSRSYRLVLGQR